MQKNWVSNPEARCLLLNEYFEVKLKVLCWLHLTIIPVKAFNPFPSSKDSDPAMMK